jgi:hypothetical protein
MRTDIEAKPASANRILMNPSDGWRGTVCTPNEEITVEAPSFREAVAAAIVTEKALTASPRQTPTRRLPVESPGWYRQPELSALKRRLVVRRVEPGR